MIIGLQVVSEDSKTIREKETSYADKGKSLRDHLEDDHDRSIYKNVLGYLMDRKDEISAEIRENVTLSVEDLERLEFFLSCFNRAIDLLPLVHREMMKQIANKVQES